jgi:hypothetical protein
MFNVFRNLIGRIRSLFTSKAAATSHVHRMTIQPYKEESINLEYNKLFCDDLALFRPSGKLQGNLRKIFTKNPFIEDLKAASNDNSLELRIRISVFNELKKRSVLNAKEVLGAVIEVGAEEGNDVLAVYKDHSATYINARGKMFKGNNAVENNSISEKIQNILLISQKILGKAEPSTEPRQAPPSAEDFRISFLVADGIYVGQGKLAEIDADPVAKALVFQAGDIMVALTKTPKESTPEVPENTLVNTPS